MTLEELKNFKPKTKREKDWYSDAVHRVEQANNFLKDGEPEGFNILTCNVKSKYVRYDSTLSVFVKGNNESYPVHYYVESGYGYNVKTESVVNCVKTSLFLHRLIDVLGKSDIVEDLYTYSFNKKSFDGIDDVKGFFKELGYGRCLDSYSEENNNIYSLTFLRGVILNQ